MASCPHFNYVVDPRNLRLTFDLILSVIRPTWKQENIHYDESPLTTDKGMINTMVKCNNSENPVDAIMIRVKNKAVSDLVQGKVTESSAIKHLYTKGCAPNILATFENGFCYAYIHGEVLTHQRLHEEIIWKCIAEEFAKYHTGTYEDDSVNRKHLFGIELIQKLLKNFPTKLNNVKQNERFQKEYPPASFFKKEIAEILDHVTQIESPVVLCHLDTRPENMVWNHKTGTVHFVDFDLIGYGYQAMEISYHFLRYTGIAEFDLSKYPDEQLQIRWIRVYLRKAFELDGKSPDDVTDLDVKRLHVQVEKFFLLVLLMNALWISISDQMEDISPGQIDWMTLSVGCLNEYYRIKEKNLALILPRHI